MRLLPRSIRVRDTLIAALLSGLVFGALGLGASALITSSVKSATFDKAQKAARRVSADLRAGVLRDPIPVDRDARLIQVVDARGDVIMSSGPVRGRSPMSALRPSAIERVVDVIECPAPDGGCYAVEAIRTTADTQAPIVLTAVPLPTLVMGWSLSLIVAGIVLALIALTAWATWLMVGRTLGPIEAIRAQLSEISATDLSRRVPQPRGEDEIAQLARTANQTLDRLERAVSRQRQFASDASHELRTPIAGLRASLEEAALYPDDIDVAATVEDALRDTDRLEAIVTDLLLLARLGTVGAAREDLDLGELARAEQRADVTVAAEDGVIVNGVRMQVVRVLANLLDNAERYGGPPVAVHVRRDGRDALLTVTDEGPGIPEADRERIFERFTRLDTARSRGAGGTGLGLAIARDVALAHGGTLIVEESPAGARFALRLPLAD
ncbi:sensor histidine kinase [Actinocorallia longicatena]|uniref:histidine kinase n=1 Tax=Actinocorallia longicatena TaxID=111803 RepID=A0ABP6QMF8_9ACTN